MTRVPAGADLPPPLRLSGCAIETIGGLVPSKW